MTLELYTPTVDTDVPRLVAAGLRADSQLAAFFTGGIFARGYETVLDGWRPTPPCLLVVPERPAPDDTQKTGRTFYGIFQVRVLAYLPPQTPSSPDVTPPGPPGAVVAGSGRVEAGVYHYALTGISRVGMSDVQMIAGREQLSPAVTVSTPSSLTITYPALTGYSAFALWRTRANGSALRFHSILTAEGPIVDDLPNAELQDDLAPIEAQAGHLIARVRRVLKAKETLVEAGVANANAALKFANGVDGRRTDWGVRVIETLALYDLRYDALTRVATAQRGS